MNDYKNKKVNGCIDGWMKGRKERKSHMAIMSLELSP